MATTTAEQGREAPGRSWTVVERRAALVAGGGLLLMALAGPVAVVTALPQGRTAAAALLMLLVAVLDVAVGLALLPLTRPGGRRAAGVAAALRVGYGVWLAVAATTLLREGDVARFEREWGTALLVFGLHLLVLGVVLVRHRGRTRPPRWLAVLVAVAGVGYVVDATLLVAGVEASFSVGQVLFVGEVLLLVWLLVRAARG